MNVTKAQKELLTDLITRTTLGETIKITSPEQHAAAVSLVNRGLLQVVGKKNYGRIAYVRSL